MLTVNNDNHKPSIYLVFILKINHQYRFSGLELSIFTSFGDFMNAEEFIQKTGPLGHIMSTNQDPIATKPILLGPKHHYLSKE